MAIDPIIHQTQRQDWSESADLRRRVKATFAQRLAEAAAHLLPADRRLIEEIYVHGRSIRDIALLTRVNHRTLSRRVKLITARVQQPIFAFVTAHRSQWSSAMRSVATQIFIGGASLSSAARTLGMSYHSVRRYRDAVLAMSTGAAAAVRTLSRQSEHSAASAGSEQDAA